jgi:hypothetical protein
MPVDPSPAGPKQSENGDDYSAIEAFVLDNIKQSQTLDERVKSVEMLKNIADARNSSQAWKQQRIQFFVTAVSPVLALIVTVVTIGFQYRQFQKTLAQQTKQSEDTAKIQRQAGDDEQWRAAIQSVSLKEPVLGAIVMQGFFDSKQYGAPARTIAGALLASVPNVNVFDEVFITMRDNTTNNNSGDLLAVAQSLGFTQRAMSHIQGAASKQNTALLQTEVDDISTDPKVLARDSEQQTRVVAWELDSVSAGLQDIWTRSINRVPASNQLLSGAVLENYPFDGIDFTKTYFNLGIFCHASFKKAIFKQAKLRQVYLCNDADVTGANFDGASLTGANLSEVLPGNFENSTWQDANWWEAQCISKELLKYLKDKFPHGMTTKQESKLLSCH